VLSERQIAIYNLPMDHIAFATRYIEAWLFDQRKEEIFLVEDNEKEVVSAKDVDAYIAQYHKAGYELGLRYVGGVLLMDETGRYGFLPCPQKNILLRPWTSTLGYETTKEFIEGTARIDVGLTPKETVYNYKGQRVGVRTQNNSVVQCKPSTVSERDTLRRTTEYELLFPDSGFVFGSFCAIVRDNTNVEDHVRIVETRGGDFPVWQENKLLLTAQDIESFQTRIRNDMVRFHRFRCYMLRQQKEINYELYDVLEGEDVVIV
jgi:hypothetical protein